MRKNGADSEARIRQERRSKLAGPVQPVALEKLNRACKLRVSQAAEIRSRQIDVQDRVATGADRKLLASVPLDIIDLEKFSWVRGESLLTSWKVPDAERFTQVFCSVCGAPVPRLYPEHGFGVAPVGGFIDDPVGREREHIFVGSKAYWWEITDDLVQYEESAP